MNEAVLLLMTAASIGFIHTIVGPDHYLVFSAMGKANNWSLGKTLKVTALCGIGHILSSVIVGVVGIVIGAQLLTLVGVESTRGSLAGWALLSFGAVYFVWGLRRALRNKPHIHVHRHGDVVHSHEHNHHGEHVHVHEHQQKSVTPWALFVIFVLGPCEALIPLLMYPAAQQSAGLVFSVALVFGVVTLVTMLGAVGLVSLGLNKFRFKGLQRFSHAIAGGSIVACASAINFMGL
ncbi:MAG: sulfite exporter TauE/SafE family protein [Pseudomonadota bacterium]